MTLPDPMNPDVEPARWGHFLNVDETLPTMRVHLDSVQLEPEVREALGMVIALNGGALALISGRTLSNLDRIFAPLKLPAAGLHGLERRRGDQLIAVHGKMIVELKPAYPNKGSAIADFLAEAPFARRMPVFLGDDVSDEAAVADWLARPHHALTLRTSASQ